MNNQQSAPVVQQRPQIVVQSFEDFQTNCFLLEMNLSRGELWAHHSSSTTTCDGLGNKSSEAQL
jgi:hypothetical protein